MNPVRSKKSKIFAEISLRTSNRMKTERTSFFLMANLGSEVAKMFSAKERGSLDSFHRAMIQAKLILSELKNIPDIKNNTEIDILADVINDLGEKTQKYEISSKQLQSYFYPFVIKLMQTQ